MAALPGPHDAAGPTRARLTEWFEKFERRIKIPLGYAPGTLAKRLQGSNFAEVEEFGTTVFRQYVLEQPNADMKDIVSKTLQSWSARSVTRSATGRTGGEGCLNAHYSFSRLHNRLIGQSRSPSSSAFTSPM